VYTLYPGLDGYSFVGIAKYALDGNTSTNVAESAGEFQVALCQNHGLSGARYPDENHRWMSLLNSLCWNPLSGLALFDASCVIPS
jgi:hypothetical protein